MNVIMKLLCKVLFMVTLVTTDNKYLKYVSSLKLEGKRALVTGASGGIGKGIALALAKEGARVLVHYHSREAGAIDTCNKIKAINPHCCDGMIMCDFRSPKAIQSMFETAIDDSNLWGGKIDILVNNAGIVTKHAIEDDDEHMGSWHETMAVNLHAPLQLSRLAFQRMKQNVDGGCIVMNTSIHGTRSVEYMTAYGTSKAALDQLTRGLSCEWAPHGIRVNAVAPGIVPVERTMEVLNSPEAQTLWRPHLPVGFMGNIDAIADSVVYICKCDWMSGSVITVDGGMSARGNFPKRPRPPSNQDNNTTGQLSTNVKFVKDP